MKLENNQINEIAKNPAMKIAGVCKMFNLKNEHKAVLFGTLKGSQCDVIEDLLEVLNDNSKSNLTEIPNIVKNFDAIPDDTHSIIFEMIELANAFKKHSNTTVNEVKWQDSLWFWIDSMFGDLTGLQTNIVLYIIDFAENGDSITEEQQWLTEKVIDKFGYINESKEKTNTFVTEISRMVEWFRNSADYENKIMWQVDFLNWLGVVRLNKPYSGYNFRDYLTRDELGDEPTTEAILDRISNLRYIELLDE